jgi:L-iditol 2-dehydrogenase
LRSTNFDPGGFSEFVRLPPINVDRGIYPLPDDMSFEEGTFIEPVACVLRGQQRANLQPGESVLVLGSGISGLLHIQLARTLGATPVMATDINPYRVQMAKKFGADETFHGNDDIPNKIREINNNQLADLVLVCTGAQSAVTQAFQSVERGGTILFFAPTDKGLTIPLPLNDIFWRNDVTLTTSYAGTPGDHMNALEFIAGGRLNVKDMITHRFGLEDTHLGFQLVAEARESMKVIIMPQK